MSKEIKQMTISEALADGYKYYSGEDGESFGKLDGLLPEEIEGVNVFLAEKEPFKYSLSADDIKGMIENHLCDQDEVYDEDMQDLLDDVDFEAVAALINPCFTKNYYHVSDIRLVP